MNAIDLFLENWKALATKYIAESKIKIEAAQAENKATKALPSYQLNLNLKRDYGFAYDMKDASDEYISKFLAVEAETKKKSLIEKVEEKAGKILDARGLTIGADGNINGTVVGSTKTVSVKTILAGGWNVQCLHFRVVVK